ncbi:MAG: nickel pincer cofactor biosynthesis protein LarB [Planctomycetes bacterium]|nr:nickel pincer cofactor biosynthesis protein LarB [Planctomycetota bacterium]
MNDSPAGPLRELLSAVQRGERNVDDALAELTRQLAPLAAGELGFATVDHDRSRRCGFPEVVFCQGKQPADAAAIAAAILERADRVLLTRATAEHAAAVQARLPAAVWHERARCLTVAPPDLPRHGRVAVVCAGTADLPVADEAAVTLAIAGNHVDRYNDIGVAGLHRLLRRLPELRQAHAVVCCAGMEGALPSVLGGLLDRPVIAVPTSVGYGASFGGLAALLTMLNSCAAGVAVVNIDNGFGAGYLASLINLRTAPPAHSPVAPRPDGSDGRGVSG